MSLQNNEYSWSQGSIVRRGISMYDKIKDHIAEIELSRTSLCDLDTLIRIDAKDLGNLYNYCENCVFREKLEKIVFCPVRCKYIRGLRVLL